MDTSRATACGLAVALVVVVGSSSCRPAPLESHRRLVRFTIGTPGGSLHPLGLALAGAYQAIEPDIEIAVQERTMSVSNAEAIQRGDADLAFAYADVAYTSFVGRMDGTPRRGGGLRGIAVLQLASVHLVARGGSAVHAVGDLRGQRLGVGQPDSSSALTARMLLKAFGVDERSVTTEPLVFSQAAVRLVDGTLDAFFVTASHPAESVLVATRGGARVLPLRGPTIDELRHDYPFLRRSVIPGGTYPGHPQPVETLGVDNLLVCSADLDESLVYLLTKRFFEALPSLVPYQDSLRLMDLEQAPATPIPLHDGAARYYRERELER